MQSKNPFDQFDGPTQRGVVVKQADPRRPYEGPMAQAELAAKQQEAELKALQIKAAQSADESPLDPATITYYAQQVLAGAPMPAMGMGRQAASGRPAIMKEVSRLGGAAGMTGADQAAQIAHFKAGSGQIANLEKQAGSIGVNEQTAIANGQQFMDRSAELPGQTNFSGLNAISNWIQRRYGGTTISAMDAAHNTFVNEYAKVVSGSPSGAGTLSDSARREAMDTIQSNASVDQKQAAFTQMKTDMSNRMVAIHGGIAGAYRALTNRPGYFVPDATQLLSTDSGGVPNNKQDPPIILPSMRGPPNGTPPGSTPPGSGGPQGGGSPRPDGTSMMYGSGDTGSNIALTAGTSKNVIDPYRAAIASHINNMMLDPKTPDAQILQAITAVGGNPGDALALVKYRRDNPKYQGTYTDALSNIPLSQESVSSGKQSFNNFATTGRGGLALGMFKGVGALGNVVTGGNLPRMMGMDPEVSKAITEQVRSKNPGMYGLGEMIGGTALSGGIGKALSLAGVPAEASLFGRQIPVAALAGDGLYGAVAGADSAPDGQKLLGAGLGALAGPAGGMLGREVVGPGVNALLPRKTTNAALNAGRRLFGSPETALPTPPSNADQSIFNAANKAGVPGIQAQLAEAHGLGVPMSLSDTNPGLTALGGSAIRRSPEAEQVATSAFLPRARGQMDRLGNAVTRDLGPVGNIPQISADMTAQARTAAGPLYDRAYGQPVISTPELDATLNTPFGRDALGRARTIAANERRAPSELGFAQDAQGNTVLNPMPSKAISDHLTARAELDDAQAAYRAARIGTGDMTQAQGRVSMARDNLRKTEQGLSAAPDPSMPANIPGYTTQTLDYVKRGMDDVLEQQRNPITGRLALDEAGRAQNGVRQQFLGEVDRLNPAYRDARQAYAGPVQARDAMARGQDAYTMHPDELGIQVANQTPEHLLQMQLGYRDSLMTAGNRQRYSSNPFDATLGSPVAEQRLSTLYPGNPGNTDILRQRDLESGLARSTNDMLGNSKSAQRLIADSEFSGSGGFMGMAAEQGMNAATGGVPVGTMLRGFAKSGIGDALKLGIGKRAIAKADAMAPTLFNTDPQASSNALQHLVDSSQLYQDYIRGNQRSVGRPFGMLGAAAGAGALSGY